MKLFKLKLFFTIASIAFVCSLITSFVNHGPASRALVGVASSVGVPTHRNQSPALVSFPSDQKQRSSMLENSPPEVVIIKPSPNDRFIWNTLIPYNIRVTDKEDGKSEYDEINAREVLLEVTYWPNSASAKNYTIKKKNSRENTGLTLIRRSDCFTCHSSKSKLIGPSFEMIANKYKKVAGSVERLTKNVISGSVGTWGTISMPAHKASQTADVKQMVMWILGNGASPNTTFYPGLEGAFKTGTKPAIGSARMVMVLTASYTDHGVKNSMQQTRYGQHTVTLKPAR